MKLIYPASLACAALFFACAIGNAQTYSNNPSANSGTSDTSTSGDKSKGNNLDTTSKAPRVDPASAPPSTGQDKSTGNNMVSPNGSPKDSGMSQTNATRPDFATLDTKKTGKLAMADVKSDEWLSKNFAKCDTDHDGSLSKEEYKACH